MHDNIELEFEVSSAYLEADNGLSSVRMVVMYPLPQFSDANYSASFGIEEFPKFKQAAVERFMLTRDQERLDNRQKLFEELSSKAKTEAVLSKDEL